MTAYEMYCSEIKTVATRFARENKFRLLCDEGGDESTDSPEYNHWGELTELPENWTIQFGWKHWNITEHMLGLELLGILQEI